MDTYDVVRRMADRAELTDPHEAAALRRVIGEARRYRWLRDTAIDAVERGASAPYCVNGPATANDPAIDGDALDGAIDAALLVK